MQEAVHGASDEGLDAGAVHDRRAIRVLAFACGGLLARAHARSGDAERIAGYCGDDDGLDRALVTFAEAYGDQTERDHDQLVKAIKNGRVRATAGDEE